jgi:hypothetical protein
VAEYLTILPPKEEFENKLRLAIANAKARMEK